MKLLLLLLIIGCGTITSRNKLLSLDSDPRGLAVRDDDDQLLGNTPLIVEKPRRKEKLYLGPARTSFKQECRYDWKHSLLPNAVVTAIYPPLGLGFYGVDWLKDRLKSCRSSYNIEATDSGRATPKKLPKRYLILPTFKLEKAQYAAMEQQFHRKLKGDFVPFEKSLQYFNHYSLYQDEDDFESLNIPEEILLKIGQQLKMTHLILIRKVEHKKLSYQVFDFYERGKSEEGSFPFEHLEQERDFGDRLSRFVRRNVFVLPNTAALSYQQLLSHEIDAGERPMELSQVERTNFVRKLYQNVIFERVQHPLAHNEYSFSFQTSPSLLTLNLDSKLTFSDTNQEYFRTELNIYAMSYNAYLYFHTPLGALSMGLGYGLAHWTEDPSNNSKRTQNASYVKGELGYTAFLTERIYARMVIESYGFARGFNVGASEPLSSISVTSFRLGYYLPEISGLFL